MKIFSALIVRSTHCAYSKPQPHRQSSPARGVRRWGAATTGPRAVVLYLRAEKKNCTKSRASRWVGLRPIPLSAAGVDSLDILLPLQRSARPLHGLLLR
jgi:hypothetical protein